MSINEKYRQDYLGILEKLPMVRPISHITRNTTKVTGTERQKISKLYRRWLLTNHPDKSAEHDNTSLFIIKEYENTLLNSEEFEDHWEFMELAEEIFSNFEKIEELSSEVMEVMSDDGVCNMLRFIHNRMKEIVISNILFLFPENKGDT